MDIKQIDLTTIYEHYQADLDKVGEVLMDISSLDTELITHVASYIIKSGGKRFRPLLTIICADLCDIEHKKHIPLAAAVEYIHTATLLHDDVVDESLTRRGQPTANNVWGNKASILVGDFLFSQAFCLMVNSGSLRVLDSLSQASNIISKGEIMQLMAIGDIELTYDHYIKIITAKTAELFAASCEIAALSDENKLKYSLLLKEFGLNLGIAFQIIDDLLDYQEETKLGKKRGDDFFEGKVTLPLILLKNQLNNEELNYLEYTFKSKEFTEATFSKLYDLIEKYNIAHSCTVIAEDYISRNIEILNHFPDSYAKDALLSLNKFVINRLG